MRMSPHGTAGLAHQLRQALLPNPFLAKPTQWGLVHAVHPAPASVDLYLTGVTNTSTFTATKTLTKGVRFVAGYQPLVGDVVLVLRGAGGNDTDRVVLGPLSGGPNTAPIHVATTAGAPTTGTWLKGTEFLDSNNVLWVCTASGTPGTWRTIALPIWAAGTALSGTAPAPGAGPYYMMCGQKTVTVSAGKGQVVFPGAFPHGLASLQVNAITSGDATCTLTGTWGTGSATVYVTVNGSAYTGAMGIAYTAFGF